MQGFNMGRYRPPSSLDPSLASADDHTTTAPRRPAGGAPTVRFEMPFAIWCSTCPEHSPSRLIGQGVRFNALKKRVGNYFSTPLWSFRIKHTACGGWIEIRTDPKNSEYVVTDGAKKRHFGDDETVAQRTGGVVLASAGLGGLTEEQQQKRQDAFAAFEGKKADAERLKKEGVRLEELKSLQDRDWRDADAAGKRLRDSFRVGRRKRDRDRVIGEKLEEQMGLPFEIVGEEEEDGQRASLMSFGGLRGDEVVDPASRPLFASKGAVAKVGKRGKINSKRVLHHKLKDNTRAAMDPFSVSAPVENPEKTRTVLGIKRKKLDAEGRSVKESDPDSHAEISAVEASLSAEKEVVDHSSQPEAYASTSTAVGVTPLVAYDSSSE